MDEIRTGYNKIIICHTFHVIAFNLAKVLATLGMRKHIKDMVSFLFVAEMNVHLVGLGDYCQTCQ